MRFQRCRRLHIAVKSKQIPVQSRPRPAFSLPSGRAGIRLSAHGQRGAGRYLGGVTRNNRQPGNPAGQQSGSFCCWAARVRNALGVLSYSSLNRRLKYETLV